MTAENSAHDVAPGSLAPTCCENCLLLSISHALIVRRAGPTAFLSVAYFHTPVSLEALYTSRAMLDVWDIKRRTTQFLSKEIGLTCALKLGTNSDPVPCGARLFVSL